MLELLLDLLQIAVWELIKIPKSWIPAAIMLLTSILHKHKLQLLLYCVSNRRKALVALSNN